MESDFHAFRPPRWLTSKNAAWCVNRLHQIKVSPVIVADDSDLDVQPKQCTVEGKSLKIVIHFALFGFPQVGN